MSDERGERGCELPLALEVDAIALHSAMGRDGEQQPVELVETVGHAREPAVRDPRVSWRDADLLMSALVVGGDERADRSVMAREIEYGLRATASGTEMAGEGSSSSVLIEPKRRLIFPRL